MIVATFIFLHKQCCNYRMPALETRCTRTRWRLLERATPNQFSVLSKLCFHRFSSSGQIDLIVFWHRQCRTTKFNLFFLLSVVKDHSRIVAPPFTIRVKSLSNNCSPMCSHRSSHQASHLIPMLLVKYSNESRILDDDSGSTYSADFET